MVQLFAQLVLIDLLCQGDGSAHGTPAVSQQVRGDRGKSPAVSHQVWGDCGKSSMEPQHARGDRGKSPATTPHPVSFIDTTTIILQLNNF